MDLDFTGFIETECGKKFKIDIFDQMAVGVVQCDNFLNDPSFIPSTFSLYKTITGLYLLETTSLDGDTLVTKYKILPEQEAAVYLDNCYLNL